MLNNEEIIRNQVCPVWNFMENRNWSIIAKVMGNAWRQMHAWRAVFLQRHEQYGVVFEVGH